MKDSRFQANRRVKTHDYREKQVNKQYEDFRLVTALTTKKLNNLRHMVAIL